MSSSPSPAGTKEALEVTFATLRSRLLGFRYLWLAVGVVVLASLLGAVIRLSWLPLLGVLLSVPLCGAFFLRDMAQVSRWQRTVLRMWAENRLDLDVFATSLLAMPLVPFSPRMLNAMLAPLPSRRKGFSALMPATREAVSVTLQTVNRCQQDKTALVTAGHTLALACLTWAAAAWSLAPLPGILAVLPALGLVQLLRALRLRRWRRQVVRLSEAGLELSTFVEIARKLEWEAIPAGKKDGLLRALCDPAPSLLHFPASPEPRS